MSDDFFSLLVSCGPLWVPLGLSCVTSNKLLFCTLISQPASQPVSQSASQLAVNNTKKEKEEEEGDGEEASAVFLISRCSEQLGTP